MAGRVTEVSFVLEKAYSPMVVTPEPMVTELRPEPLKANLPIEVTELGIVTEVRLSQPLNISWPILVMEPRLTLVRASQS